MELPIKFDQQGLIPAIIQDDSTEEVLMVAFMNQEALQRTRETGNTYFFSRSRNKIWHKGEQSGNVQEVRAIFVNCEENSLLIRVRQHGDAACHDGYHSCYYRRLLPDNSYQTVAERIFDPAVVYKTAAHSQAIPVKNETNIAVKPTRQDLAEKLQSVFSQLYDVYLYLRDHDLSQLSNTSRLLQVPNQSYLLKRLADELQELADVQRGQHVHTGLQADTVLEGSQVGYWLFLLAASCDIDYADFMPHCAVFSGYNEHPNEVDVIEWRKECLRLSSNDEPVIIARGIQLGFAFVGWACAEAGVSPLGPGEYDLGQMRLNGLVK